MERPLRKDAASRRSALLRAAKDVFATEGINTPLDRIAERAGVGRATLYRNFPGRTEIALAVLLEDVAELGARFETATAPDAYAAFITALSERLVRNAALGEVIREAPSPDMLAPLRTALVAAATPPLMVSMNAGTVRSDLTPGDIRVISTMLGAGLQNARPDERNAIAARALELVLDALRVRA